MARIRALGLAAHLSTPLDRDLPGEPASPRQVAYALAELAAEHGQLTELAAILEEEPRRSA